MPTSAYSTPTFTQYLKKEDIKEKQDNSNTGMVQGSMINSIPTPLEHHSQGIRVKMETPDEKKGTKMQETVSTGIRDDFDIFNEFSSLDYYEPPLFGSESFIDNYVDASPNSPPPNLVEPLEIRNNSIVNHSNVIPSNIPVENHLLRSNPIPNHKKTLPLFSQTAPQQQVVHIPNPILAAPTSSSSNLAPIASTPALLAHPMVLNVPQVSSSVEISKEPNRLWELQRAAPGFETVQFSIEMKHRRESRHQSVDDIFYSSLRYQIFIKLVSEQLPQLRQLRVIINLIDATNLSVVEPMKGDQVVVKGSNFLLTNICGTTLKGSTSIHIPSKYSYHFLKRDYRLVISFYPKNDSSQPCFVLQSPQFRLFARRPNKKQFSREKQKRLKQLQNGKRRRLDSDSDNDEDVLEQPFKKFKHSFSEPSLTSFVSMMNQISKMTPNMNEEEKILLKKATSDFLEKLS
mmetsp:Transcript_912/g.1435  ORF Transcript_912/g.1435 Transcript_912/m.1435 type:complete len:459 (+) Transcript_912:246-1622(+)